MLKDLFFPKICLVCGFWGSYICLTCEKKLIPIIHDKCLYCGTISPLGLTHTACKQKNGIDGILSLYFYNPTLKSVIRNIKYKGVYDAFHEVFLSMGKPNILKLYKFRRKFPEAFLQPIPLHFEKIRKRGFNQSRYIAGFIEYLIEYTKVDLLTRNKNTRAQATIKDRQSRYQNMKNAFSLKEDITLSISPGTVILIDDVVTTGSTVREAAHILKVAGARNVFVFCLARG